MQSFLKGRMLWRYITGEKKRPTQGNKETDEAFLEQLEVRDAANYCIITWFSNTSAPSISMLFGHFELAKDAWDFLQQQYSFGDFAQRY